MSRAAAVDNLTWRLKDGKTVGGLNLADLIDADLNGQNSDLATTRVIDILLSEYPDTPSKRDAYVDELITRYLASPKGEALIQEEAATIAAEAEEDERFERETA